MDQIFILVLFVLMVAAVAYAFNRRTDEALSGDEILEAPSPPPPAEPIVPLAQKARKTPSAKSAKKPSKKSAKKAVKKPRNRREL